MGVWIVLWLLYIFGVIVVSIRVCLVIDEREYPNRWVLGFVTWFLAMTWPVWFVIKVMWRLLFW